MSQIKKIPFFFVIGRARSGTTLLRTMFDAHPNVIIPLESPLIMHLNRKYGNIKSWNKSNLLLFYQDVLKIKDFNKWDIDREILKKKILSQSEETNFRELISLIYLQSKSLFLKEDIKLIGDKNPVYSISIKSIFRLYPDARYIHLQRDYRAHILSMINAGLYAKDIVALAYRWKYSAKLLAKLKLKYPDNFYSVKYEDLVCNPEKYMKQLCAFLDIDYHSDMINYHVKLNSFYKEFEDKIEDHHKRVFKPIDGSRINSWKTELTSQQIEIADFVVGEWADKEGYDKLYANPGLSVRLKVIPAILYQRLFYIYKYFYTKLPQFLRISLDK